MRSAGFALHSAFFVLLIAAGANAQTAETSCDRFLPAPRDVKGGKKVGPASCAMKESDVTIDGRAFKRIDVGLNGSVEGYATKQGEYKDYLTQSPDLVFPQSGNPGPVLFAIANYERDKGASMAIVYPRDRAAWNLSLIHI